MSGYPTKATILVRKGPKGTPWVPYAECVDHGQENDPDFEELRHLRPKPVEDQIAKLVRDICKDRAWAILIVWDNYTGE